MNNQQLSTEINNNYIILFHDQTKKEVSYELGEKILMLSTTAQKTFILDKQLYSFASISKFLPISEYYAQYPDERPDFINYPDVDYTPVKINWSKQKRINNIKSMIRGFKEYFKERIIPKKSQKILDRMEIKLEETEKEEDTKKPMESLASYF